MAGEAPSPVFLVSHSTATQDRPKTFAGCRTDKLLFFDVYDTLKPAHRVEIRSTWLSFLVSNTFICGGAEHIPSDARASVQAAKGGHRWGGSGLEKIAGQLAVDCLTSKLIWVGNQTRERPGVSVCVCGEEEKTYMVPLPYPIFRVASVLLSLMCIVFVVSSD